ncbi:MAG TPA: hypothetical protein VLF67_00595 [Candidatus Saccharimonas sp.]|nr:hypothetical protein [Candidatus Saccharimonas sp.]
MPQPVHQPAPQPAPPQPAPEPRVAAPEPARGRRRGWWIVLQFVIGLAIIAGVAAAIVVLYIRYYQ